MHLNFPCSLSDTLLVTSERERATPGWGWRKSQLSSSLWPGHALSSSGKTSLSSLKHTFCDTTESGAGKSKNHRAASSSAVQWPVYSSFDCSVDLHIIALKYILKERFSDSLHAALEFTAPRRCFEHTCSSSDSKYLYILRSHRS